MSSWPAGLSGVDHDPATRGPRLASGERTLLLVSDDNSATEEFTRFIALALR
ncbi:hypothetical protein AB0425_02775 [Actinosynnema sp. NPDC051121]|nr:hypothetical protein [Saccharothrix sp.]